MNSAFFLILRRMRAPLILLVIIYGVSVLGLTLIPGADAQGKPVAMGFFHAFYFISYTATTIGFGEIPNAFTDAQRMWVTVCIYLSVIGWAYGIGTLLTLLQDRAFLQAVTAERFARFVRRIREPFYLVCGYGETGQLLCRSLDALGYRFVVLDVDSRRVDEMELHDYRADTAGLSADAREPEVLVSAGLTSRHCRGVFALTSDDAANLAVAISARLLAPGLPALCRALTPEMAANMASFGTPHIINPYEKFADYLALAVRSPGSYQLMEWLTGVPDSHLQPQREPPRGRWIVCGYGRFGRALLPRLEREGLELTVVDPNPLSEGGARHVVGLGTEAHTLDQAGVREAVGIVAGTEDDTNNLSIVVTAQQLNPDLFVVVRQNLQANRRLFHAFAADFTVLPSEIIAHECLAIITTPLLPRFLDHVRAQSDAWADAVVQRLTACFGDRVPHTWSVCLDAVSAPSLTGPLARGKGVGLGALLRDPGQRDDLLRCVVLMHVRAGAATYLPPDDLPLAAGDELLLAGTRAARHRLEDTLANANTRDYVLYGRDVPDGWVWQWLSRPSHRGSTANAGPG